MRRYRAYVQPLMALLAVCILLITGGLYMLSNRLVSNSYAGLSRHNLRHGRHILGRKPAQPVYLSLLTMRVASIIAAQVHHVHSGYRIAGGIHIGKLRAGKHAEQRHLSRRQPCFLRKLPAGSFLHVFKKLHAAAMIAPHAVIRTLLQKQLAALIYQYHAGTALHDGTAAHQFAHHFDILFHMLSFTVQSAPESAAQPPAETGGYCQCADSFQMESPPAGFRSDTSNHR